MPALRPERQDRLFQMPFFERAVRRSDSAQNVDVVMAMPWRGWRHRPPAFDLYGEADPTASGPAGMARECRPMLLTGGRQATRATLRPRPDTVGLVESGSR